ncbi:ROK family protein [Phyllobacterium phragmitis]|uniref:ROK family protein n=1 Tax=Phyllobacterium phragmitis TaxID=2670329 RepID=A0A2S9IT56_9HYPH|nr:ROK family protein [Phyllobacterium phragmitis]PRD43707.1 ROK family protein [Phyllobacterium phragmitis]
MFTVIDVGGTHLRWARWTRENGVRDRCSSHTPNFRRHPELPAPQLRKRLVDAICKLVPDEPDAVVGVSFGAALNQLNGTVYASAPLWGAYDVPFDLLDVLSRRRTDVDWHIVNDVTAALLDVASSPLCAQDRKVMLVTISTGIAARTIDRSTMRIPVDASGLQGEIGHLPASAVLFGEPLVLNCDCGKPGHLSAYSSGPGIAQMAQSLRVKRPQDWATSLLGLALAEGLSLEEAFKSAVVAQDSLATKLLDAVTAPIADILRTALCLDPDLDRIVLTGGVAIALGVQYRDAILQHLSSHGLYLTSKYNPNWAADRIVVYETDCLVGAGIAALMARAK